MPSTMPSNGKQLPCYTRGQVVHAHRQPIRHVCAEVTGRGAYELVVYGLPHRSRMPSAMPKRWKALRGLRELCTRTQQRHCGGCIRGESSAKRRRMGRRAPPTRHTRSVIPRPSADQRLRADDDFPDTTRAALRVSVCAVLAERDWISGGAVFTRSQSCGESSVPS